MRLSQHIAYAGNSTQSNGSHQAMDEEREARRESPRQHRVRPPGDIQKQKEKKKIGKDRKRADIEYYVEKKRQTKKMP